jgi:SAM-dependent methyltransferase
MTTRHLDIGCGKFPRNPYHAIELHGVDIMDPATVGEPIGFSYKQANPALHGLPFDSNYFDSVSAFDFLEHIPRVLLSSNSEYIFPFIDLMNEIHRVLKPGGYFLAATPAFPYVEAFQDPTHVNILTKNTLKYFVSEKAYARNYGYTGNFEIAMNKFGYAKNYYDAEISVFAKIFRAFSKRLSLKDPCHLIWKAKAIK